MAIYGVESGILAEVLHLAEGSRREFMVVEFDEKGKFFTDVIVKDVIRSHIQTQEHTILGFVHVRRGERLSDEINKPNTFLAITEAEIYNQSGEQLYTSDFLVVNRKHIVWLMPIDERKARQE
jgi:hypothetical protein